MKATAWSQKTPLGSRRVAVYLLSAYLFGLLLMWYEPLVFTINNMQLLRPDWLVSVPLVAYLLVYERKLELSYPHAYAGLFLLVGIGSFLTGQQSSPVDFLTVCVQVVYTVVLFVVVSNLPLTERTYRELLRVFVSCLVAISIHTLYEAVALNTLLPFVGLDDAAGAGGYEAAYSYFGFTRPSSVFAEPTQLASVLVIGVALLLPLISVGRPIVFSRRRQLASLFIVGLALLTTGSLAGYILLFVVLFSLYVGVRQVRSVINTLLPLLLVGGSLSAILVSVVGVDLYSITVGRLVRLFEILLHPERMGTSSISIRFTRAVGVLNVLASHPVLSVGFGQHASTVPTVLDASPFGTYPVSRLQTVNGGWLLVLAETGIVGLLLFGGIWVRVARRGIATVREGSEVTSALAVASVSATFAAACTLLFNFSYVLPHVWVFGGLSLSLFQHSE